MLLLASKKANCCPGILLNRKPKIILPTIQDVVIIIEFFVLNPLT